MKNRNFILLLLGIAALTAGLVIGCHETKTDFKPSPNDTARVPVLYMDPQTDLGRLDRIFRITKDSTRLDTLSNGTLKPVSYRDTLYYYPQLIPVRDSTGAVVKDAMGRDSSQVIWNMIPNNDELILISFSK